MAFHFDAREELQRIRNRTAGGPTLPNFPTEPPKTDATVGTIGTVGRSRDQIACCETPTVGIEEIAGASSPSVDTFAERAAIAEFEGGLSRYEAEQLAAEEQGFASAEALHGAAAQSWALKISALARHERDPVGRRCLAHARQFIDEGWTQRALIAGWVELELFGVCPNGRWARLDRLGAAYFCGPVVAATPAAIGFAANPTPLLVRRASRADGAFFP